MNKLQLQQLITDLNPILKAVLNDRRSPNREVAATLSTALNGALDRLNSSSGAPTEIKVLDNDIAVLTALQEAYTSAKGLGAHSPLRSFNFEALNINFGSSLKLAIANVTFKYFGNDEQFKDTVQFLKNKIDEKQREMRIEQGWIEPDEKTSKLNK